MTLYRIHGWNDHYENNRSRKIKDLRWVAFPNRHDGETFTLIMAHPEGAVIFTGWVLMVQIASKCVPRGTLIRGNGIPHNVTSMSAKCRCPDVWFKTSIDYLVSNTDWLEHEEFTAERHSGAPSTSPERHSGDEEGREGMERREGTNPLSVELPPRFPKTVDDAVRQCMAYGIPAPFIAEVWSECAGIGGKTSYGGQNIENWPVWLNGQWLRRQNLNGERHSAPIRKKGGTIAI